MLNKVMLIGNVGADPEVRYLEGTQAAGQGSKVATLRLATTERYRDRAGEQKENTEWHNIVAWRNLADLCEKFIKKGTQIYVEGRLRTRTWTDQTGAKRYSTEILADNIQLLGRRSDNPGAQPGDYQAPAQSGYQRQGGYQQGGYQQPAYQQPAAPAYQPQPAYAAPQPAPAYAPQPAAPEAINIDLGDGSDDLPF